MKVNLNKVLLLSVLSTTLVAEVKEDEFLKPRIPNNQCYVEVYTPLDNEVILGEYVGTFTSNDDRICTMIDASYTYNGFITFHRPIIIEATIPDSSEEVQGGDTDSN